MEFTLSLLTHNQQYLILLAVIMALSFSAKKTGVFIPFYKWISKKVKSKRMLVMLISAFSGVLPISGRASVSAGALDTVASNKKPKGKFGIVDYLSTHHYYFWSPLEATVLVPMAALGITYFQFIEKIYPLLITAIIIILYYIFNVLKEDDIYIDFSENNKTSWKEDRKQIASYAKTLIFIAFVIAVGNIAKTNADELKTFLENAHSSGSALFLVVGIGFLASFALGSSGKFAGFTALSSVVFGIEYLPLFFAFDYAGYMLSPMHKCLAIGKSYFNTPIKDYYKAIISLVVPIIGVAILLTLFVMDL